MDTKANYVIARAALVVEAKRLERESQLDRSRGNHEVNHERNARISELSIALVELKAKHVASEAAASDVLRLLDRALPSITEALERSEEGRSLLAIMAQRREVQAGRLRRAMFGEAE